jgi:hypothetical protein
MLDFNIRSNSELSESVVNYSAEPIITDRLQLFLQELDVLFSTDKYECLSYPEIDNNIESLIWKTKLSADSVKSALTTAISTNCMMSEYFNYSMQVKLYKGALRDIVEITIDIKNTDKTLKYLFK